MKIIDKDYRWRQVGECADTWYKWIQPTETGNTETKCRFLRYQTQWQSTPRGKFWSLFLLWQLIGIDWWQEENVEPFRLTVLRHHLHCCICRSSYYHNIISPGSPPVFLECTSDTYLIIHFHLNKAFMTVDGEQCQFRCSTSKPLMLNTTSTASPLTTTLYEYNTRGH